MSDINHKKEILNSYKTIYENIQVLNFNNKKSLIQLIGKDIDNLEIDNEPRLIIFAVDINKKDDIHIQKLKTRFDDKRLILKYEI